MKKLIQLSFVMVAVLALAASPIFAGEGCSASKDAKAGKAGCSTMSAEQCAKLCGAKGVKGVKGASATLSPEECAKLCGDNKNCDMTQISIKGMTCGGCEKDVEAALTAVPGVLKVVKVSHKEGFALVCTDKAKCEAGSLTKAVSAKGYEAQIIPAVAKTTAATGSTCGMGAKKVDATQASSKKACGPECTKDCCAKKGDAKKPSDTDSK